MSQKQNRIHFIIHSALIAAIYVGLTFLSSIFNLAYGPIQFRVSEVLTILPVFTPAAIPGLTVGCFIANFASFNLLDIVFGTLATLIAAVLTYMLRNFKLKGIPFLAFLPPILVNALVIGLEIALFFLPQGSLIFGFLISAFQVGIGQTLVCYGLGIPFYIIVSKYSIFDPLKK